MSGWGGDAWDVIAGGKYTRPRGAGTTEKSRRITSSAAGERPGILRHSRH
jgi:hypothetical protein